MTPRTIGFIGQGAIASICAEDFAERGYEVVRYERGQSNIKDQEHIRECDIVFICLPTPVLLGRFDDSGIREAIKLVGKNKIAIIRSNIAPGATESIQKENPDIFVMYMPEFARQETAERDIRRPSRNIIGVPEKSDSYYEKARKVIAVLPKAHFNLICWSRNAELIRYGNTNFSDLFFDLVKQSGGNWEVVKRAVLAGAQASEKNNSHPAKESLPAEDVKKRKPKSIVTGGAGFIGSNLVDELIRQGHEVIIIDDLSTGKAEYINPQAKFYRVDVRELEKLEQLFAQEAAMGQIDYIFHLAAQMDVRVSVADPIKDNHINVVGSINIFNHAVKHKVKKVVFFSTGGAMYGNVDKPTTEEKLPDPDSPYAIHKLAAEHNLIALNKLHGLNYSILRPGNVFGPRQYKGGEGAAVAIFTYNNINDKESMVFGDGRQTRDYVYVDDVVRAAIIAAEHEANELVNIGTERPTSVLDLISIIKNITNKEFLYHHEPARPGEVRHSVLNRGKAKRVFGWQPEVSLEEGISRTINWAAGNNNFPQAKKKDTILVTGSAGFIGFHVAKRLLEDGCRVIGLDNFNDYYDPQLKEDRNSILELDENYKLYRGNLADADLLKIIFQENKIDKICHFAAQAGVRYSLSNPHVYIESNVVGFANLIEEARAAGIKKFVYASSSSVYGNNSKIPFSVDDSVDQPISLYGATKKSNELIAHTYHWLYKMNCIGLRFFTVYGPWGRPDMAYFKFADKIRKKETIEVYNYGKMKRDFTYIDDIVEGVMAALDKDIEFGIFNLGNNQPEELEDMINLLESNLGIKAEKKYLPLQAGDFIVNWADIDKTREILGFAPKTSLSDGIRRFTKWYQDYYR